MWKLISFILGFVPNIFKYFQRKGKINDVKKIDNAVDAGDDKSINTQLRDIVSKADDNSKANS